jgi:hypothetical protein
MHFSKFDFPSIEGDYRPKAALVDLAPRQIDWKLETTSRLPNNEIVIQFMGIKLFLKFYHSF